MKVRIWTIVLGVAVLLIFLSLGIFGFIQSKKRSDADEILAMCGIGTSISAQTGTHVGIARGMRNLEAQGLVAYEEIGALARVSAPKGLSESMYEDYTSCISEQMKLKLVARGVTITDPTKSETTMSNSTAGPCSDIIVNSKVERFSKRCENLE